MFPARTGHENYILTESWRNGQVVISSKSKIVHFFTLNLFFLTQRLVVSGGTKKPKCARSVLSGRQQVEMILCWR
jgi:hypothetical protein